MKIKVLLVDGNNLLYRAYHKFSSFTHKPTGEKTGAIYGFFKVLHSNLMRYKPDQIVVVFDERRSKHRMKVMPDYKKRPIRLDMDFSSLNKQKRIIMRMLRMLNIPYIKDTNHKHHYECDDYIAWYVSKHLTKDILVLSSDEDFIQLLNWDHVKVVSPNKDAIISRETCKRYFGYDAFFAVDYKILVGDTSDNIPGYKGIGPKTAMKFLEKYHSIHRFLKYTKDKFGNIDRDTLQKVYDTNKFMIDLNHYINLYPLNKKQIPWHYRQGHKFKRDYFYITCSNFSLNSFQTKEFLKPFLKLKPDENI